MQASEIRLPALFSQREIVDGNAARQIVAWPESAALQQDGNEWSVRTESGETFPLRKRGATPVGETGLELPLDAWEALPAAPDGQSLKWMSNRRVGDPEAVLASLAGRFRLKLEDPEAGGQGLRVPQAGALHAVLAHWSTGSSDPGTVVLPTGTGKTETMIALFASERLHRVLVVVPSDKLRSQIAEAFESFGVLRRAGVVEGIDQGPVVGRIEHGFDGIANARRFVEGCNVIIATPNALRTLPASTLQAIADRCSHLFVDEAHHVPAPTWAAVVEAFASKPVVQFTATPFRQDGQRLGGRVIYSFPLGRAQEMGYFQPISYISVVGLTEPDRRVAEAAIEKLRDDRAAGLDHLVMARVRSIKRATDEVLPLYEELAPEFSPQVLHSNLSAGERRNALAAIESRSSRVIICVDMLGEGFDFPEMKIAALHDPQRSLGVALQFIGRFARSRADLGTATAVVAQPDPGYDERLRALYAERNEWDRVINVLSSQAIEAVREIDDFERGFSVDETTEGVSVHTLKPKMSTVVFETAGEWHPEKIEALFDPDRIVAPVSVNAEEKVAWLVVEVRSSIRWAHLKSFENVAFHLHVLYWDEGRRLLFINTSELESLQENLAEATCGGSARLITGERPYRALGELQRAVPTNVGVIDLRNRSRRFSMYVGADVYEGFPVAEQQSKANTNIFVVAYDEGERVTLGAARKGRIWSQQAAESVFDWVRWCRRLGPRLQDDALTLDALFRSFVRPRALEERPPLIPLAIDWPVLAYAGLPESAEIEISGERGLLIDAELVITKHDEEGAIPYEVRIGDAAAEYTATVGESGVIHEAAAEEAIVVYDRAEPEALSAYLQREGATIWFESEVAIEGDVLYELNREARPIDLGKLEVLTWDKVDIRRESQGPKRDPETVQAYAAAHLLTKDQWDVVLDDDETGEIADLVAIRADEERFLVHLVHCKFSSKERPGARVEDLYEVCGQAHRSAHHRQHFPEMVRNLIRRERARRQKGRTGLLHGSDEQLLALRELVRQRRPELRVTIAQPGLSKGGARERHLQILAATDVYVSEIAHGSFDIWCSA